jgi:transposase InsO family protein
LATVIDLCTRMVVGWASRPDHMRANRLSHILDTPQSRRWERLPRGNFRLIDRLLARLESQVPSMVDLVCDRPV